MFLKSISPHKHAVKIVTACFAFAIGGNAIAQPQSKGLWVLPDQFIEDGDPPQTTDRIKILGKDFANAFKTRDPGISISYLEGSNVTRPKIISEMRRQLDSFDSKKGPLVFTFYYGGHGIKSNRLLSATYLAMNGAQISDGDIQYEKLMMLDEILAIQAEYEHVIFQGFIDCCYAGNTRFVNDRAFSSEQFGAKAYIMCATDRDKKAYDATSYGFTENLTKIFSNEDSYSKVKKPLDIVEMIYNTGNLMVDQSPMIIPDTTPISWPANRKMCFLVIKFGKFIRSSVRATIETDDGKFIPIPVKQQNYQSALGCAISVPRLKGKISFVIGESSMIPETGGLDINLLKSSELLDLSRYIQNVSNASDLVTTNSSFPSAEDFLLQRGREFGLSPQENGEIAIALIQSAVSFSNDDIENIAMPWAKKIAASPKVYGVDQKTVDLLSSFSGTSPIPITEEGYEKLLALKEKRLNFTKPVTTAEVEHIRKNIDIIAGEYGAEWIDVSEIPDAIISASVSSKISNNPQALNNLSNSVINLSKSDSKLELDSEKMGDLKKAVDLNTKVSPMNFKKTYGNSTLLPN